MRCNGLCSQCNLCSVTIIKEDIVKSETQIESVAEPLKETVTTEPVVIETGLVPAEIESAGEFVVTKNIFGKEVVKKVK